MCGVTKANTSEEIQSPEKKEVDLLSDAENTIRIIMKEQLEQKVTESTAWWMVRPLVDREDIIKHIKECFIALYPKKSGSDLLQITLSFLASRRIKHLGWKKTFEEEEDRAAIFGVGGYELGLEGDPGLDGFPIVFFQAILGCY